MFPAAYADYGTGQRGSVVVAYVANCVTTLKRFHLVLALTDQRIKTMKITDRVGKDKGSIMT